MRNVCKVSRTTTQKYKLKPTRSIHTARARAHAHTHTHARARTHTHTFIKRVF